MVLKYRIEAQGCTSIRLQKIWQWPSLVHKHMIKPTTFASSTCAVSIFNSWRWLFFIAKQSILRNSYCGKTWRCTATMPLPNGTAANYKLQLRAYHRLCLFFGYTPVPCRAIHLLRYIVFLARTLYWQNSQLSQRCSSFASFAPAVYMAPLTHLKTSCSSIRKLSSWEAWRELMENVRRKSYLLHPKVFTKCNATCILIPRLTPLFGQHVW